MKEVNVKQALEKKYPESVVLLTSSSSSGKANIITLGWSMQTSFDPPMLAVSIGKTRYSHKLVSQTKEFVLCFPSQGQEEDVLFCGTHSGHEVDKFVSTNLRPVKAKFVKPPLLENSVACFECKIVESVETGDHTIFVGEIVASYISEKPQKRIYNFGKYHLKVIE